MISQNQAYLLRSGRLMPLIQYLARIPFDFGAINTLGEEISRLGLNARFLSQTRARGCRRYPRVATTQPNPLSQ